MEIVINIRSYVLSDLAILELYFTDSTLCYKPARTEKKGFIASMSNALRRASILTSLLYDLELICLYFTPSFILKMLY